MEKLIFNCTIGGSISAHSISAHKLQHIIDLLCDFFSRPFNQPVRDADGGGN
jgi:hypothetical protein